MTRVLTKIKALPSDLERLKLVVNGGDASFSDFVAEKEGDDTLAALWLETFTVNKSQSTDLFRALSIKVLMVVQLPYHQAVKCLYGLSYHTTLNRMVIEPKVKKNSLFVMVDMMVEAGFKPQQILETVMRSMEEKSPLSDNRLDADAPLARCPPNFVLRVMLALNKHLPCAISQSYLDDITCPAPTLKELLLEDCDADVFVNLHHHGVAVLALFDDVKDKVASNMGSSLWEDLIRLHNFSKETLGKNVEVSLPNGEHTIYHYSRQPDEAIRAIEAGVVDNNLIVDDWFAILADKSRWEACFLYEHEFQMYEFTDEGKEERYTSCIAAMVRVLAARNGVTVMSMMSDLPNPAKERVLKHLFD